MRSQETTTWASSAPSSRSPVSPAPERDPGERVDDHREVDECGRGQAAPQGARCMDCGVAFCHAGCPLGNLIPDWNDLVYQRPLARGDRALHATNDFPEFTGLICPAPCESACVLAINDDAVMIKPIEFAIVERAWEEGWVGPVGGARAGRRVAVIGSGAGGAGGRGAAGRAGPVVALRARRGRRRPAALRRAGREAREGLVDRRVDAARGRGRRSPCGVDVGATCRRRASWPTRHARMVIAPARAAPGAPRPAPSWPGCTWRWTTSTGATARSRAGRCRARAGGDRGAACTSW